MTWPWIGHLRNAIADPGDPYAHAYFLWWDYHQTLHDPLNLFNATIFYPYRNSLAFGENDYGISLLFFPLFALGLRPLTVYSVAAFISFPFSGYGAFRLARTLGGSSAAAWVAGIIFAFLPYRFHHLSHLPIIFAGWIPLLLESLVLFARKRSWRLAAWLGFAFLMNALTCLTWFILTLIPLGLSAVLLLTRYRIWRDRTFWLRIGVSLAAASLLLLPFLLPFRRVAELHKFERSSEEVLKYSARPINWLAADLQNKLWSGLGRAGVDTEMVLFPGLLPPLLALAAFFFIERRSRYRKRSGEAGSSSRMSTLLVLLDTLTILSGVTAILTFGYDVFQLRLFGYTILSVADSTGPLVLLALALLARCSLSYPEVLRASMRGEPSLIATLRSERRSELFAHGFIWTLLGFMGSFGLNFTFHRALYEFTPIFKAMRVAVRWSMICYLGLALLAGLGASRLVAHLKGHWPSLRTAPIYALLILSILFEQRVAPLKMMRGEVNPDQLTLYLKEQKMAGGIVELPAGQHNHLYMLRAADHGKPLVNAIDSFVPPLEQQVEAMTRSRPIPESFLDLLEGIPVSYLTVHNSLLSPNERREIERFLALATASGRLRFIASFDGARRNDLYAVTKTEPHAQSGNPPPAYDLLTDESFSKAGPSTASAGNPELEARLLDAAARGDNAAIESLLEQPVNVNTQSTDGRTPLTEAAYNGHLETVKLLLDKGADPGLEKPDGSTALSLAHGRSEITELFEDVDRLVEAASHADERVMKDLLEKGVPVNAKDQRGRTPLVVAVLSGRADAVNFLLKNGADPTRKVGGASILSLATERGDKQIIELLNKAATKKSQQ